MAQQARLDGMRQYRRFLEAVSGSAKDPSELMEQIGAYGVSSTVRRISGGIAPDNAPLTQSWKKGSNTPLRDTGRFMGSIATKHGRTWTAWGSNAKQARILQQGGTIRPKKGKHLLIPAGWQTRRLMRRYGETPGRCIAGMRKDRYSIWRQGNVLMSRRTKRSRPFVLFILKTSVQVPARQYLHLDDNDRQEILALTTAFLSDALP
jgi:phage gpG-like protein